MSKPFMTKKHYDFIASIFRGMVESEVVGDPIPSDVIEFSIIFADCLEQTNPLFKRDMFLQACGVKDGTDNTSSRDKVA